MNHTIQTQIDKVNELLGTIHMDNQQFYFALESLIEVSEMADDAPTMQTINSLLGTYHMDSAEFYEAIDEFLRQLHYQLN